MAIAAVAQRTYLAATLLVKEEGGRPYGLFLPIGRSNFKLPAGMAEGEETPLEAALRETPEEIGVIVAPQDLHEVCAIQDVRDKTHFRHFFGSQKWEGEIRTEEKPEDDGGKIDIPQWVLLRPGFTDSIIATHREGYREVLRWAGKKLEAFYYLARKEKLL